MPNHNKGNNFDTDIEINIANGPIQKRSCTDILCLLIFIAFIGGMFTITGYAIHNGKPELIGGGYDADGNICGYSEGYEDYPLLYWPAPVNGLLTHTVCVAKCPTDPLPTTLDCKTNSQVPSCTSNTINTNPNTFTTNTFLIYNTTNCKSFLLYSSFANHGTYMLIESVPSVGVTFAQISDKFIDSDLLGHWVSDIRTTWPIIAASIGIAFVIGLIEMVFLRYCVGIMTWAAILFFIIGLAILSWQYYDRSIETKRLIDSTENTDSDSNLKDTELIEKIIAFICWGFAALNLITVLCLFRCIRLAVGLLKAAADYIKDTWSVMLVLPVFFVVLLLLYVYWGITTVYLVSSGAPSQVEDMPVGTFKFDKTVQRLLIYHLFALLWCNSYVLAASQFVIASSVCIWYFTQGTGKAGSGSIRKGVYRLLRYHLGSIPFGSLVLSIVQLIRGILSYMESKTKQWAEKEGKLIRLILCCFQCYVACFERFIKFLNKTAWIQIAMTGKNFCAAARKGLSLAIHNPLRYNVTGGVGNIFVLFGKFFVASISTLIGFIIITKANTYSDEIYSPSFPVMFLFTYTVGALFLNVYGMAADTILTCFLIDKENQSKRNAPALHCPSSLKEFLDKSRNNEN